MLRMTRVKLVAAVVAAVSTAGGGIVAVNQLMASRPPMSAMSSSEPTTRPSMASAPQDLNATSPKAALRALAAATRAADVERMKQLVDIKNPSEEQLLLAACEYAVARKTFFQAVNSRYGEPAEERLSNMLRLNEFDLFLRDLETNTDGRTEHIRGDQSILTTTSESAYSQMRMVRENNWKLSAANMLKEWPQEKYGQVLTEVQQGSSTLRDLTNGINEGRFPEFPDLARTVRGMTRGR